MPPGAARAPNQECNRLTPALQSTERNKEVKGNFSPSGRGLLLPANPHVYTTAQRTAPGGRAGGTDPASRQRRRQQEYGTQPMQPAYAASTSSQNNAKCGASVAKTIASGCWYRSINRREIEMHA